jgi:predicted amidophosphoribosyltransferase
MTLPIHSQVLRGNWRYGWALELHTVSSTRRPDGSFETKRTKLGELLYRLKYQLDRSQVEPISGTAANFLTSLRIFRSFAAIIPVPPSVTTRPFQPVQELAERIGAIVGLPVPLDYLIKTKATTALKGLDDPTSRKEILKGAFKTKDCFSCRQVCPVV